VQLQRNCVLLMRYLFWPPERAGGRTFHATRWGRLKDGGVRRCRAVLRRPCPWRRLQLVSQWREREVLWGQAISFLNPDGREACYGRVFNQAHLARHRGQKVALTDAGGHYLWGNVLTNLRVQPIRIVKVAPIRISRKRPRKRKSSVYTKGCLICRLLSPIGEVQGSAMAYR